MKLIKRGYEEGYHDNILYREQPNSQRNQKRLEALLSYKSAGRLLEVGCGKGGLLRVLEPHFEVEGVDISHSAIAAARLHFNDKVNVLNIEQRSLPADRYDAIVAFNILEHLRQPGRAVEKLYRALVPGGVMIGSVPNNFGIIGSLTTHIGNFFDRTHVSTFTPDTWRRIFTHAGFNTIEFFGELNAGRNHCRYLQGRWWPYISFNLMFACTKIDSSR